MTAKKVSHKVNCAVVNYINYLAYTNYLDSVEKDFERNDCDVMGMFEFYVVLNECYSECEVKIKEDISLETSLEDYLTASEDAKQTKLYNDCLLAAKSKCEALVSDEERVSIDRVRYVLNIAIGDLKLGILEC